MSKIKPNDIYKCLWICRDFEVDHLWQRSVFLAGFLLACFAGYGALASAALFPEDGKPGVPKELVNAIGFCICLIGVVLSLLWLMMAKGSKAWYERYEQAIEAFANSYPGQFENAMARLDGFHWEKMPKYKAKPLSNWLCNSKGGEYSPSKINYGLGIVSFVIWSVLALAHVACAGCGFRPLAKSRLVISLASNWIILTALGATVIVATCFWGVFGLRSGFLGKNK